MEYVLTEGNYRVTLRNEPYAGDSRWVFHVDSKDSSKDGIEGWDSVAAWPTHLAYDLGYEDATRAVRRIANTLLPMAEFADGNALERYARHVAETVHLAPFDWSLERHLMTQLYRARNTQMLTYTYVFNRNGGLLFSCESMGFPIPATTQLTNPQTVVYNNGGTAIPQAEPNGLYAPPDTDGTFVMCLGASPGVVEPVYIEDPVITTTRRMVMTDGRLSPAPGSYSPTQLRTTR